MGGSEWGLGGTLPDVFGRRHTAKAQLLVKQQIRKEICFLRKILDSPICLSDMTTEMETSAVLYFWLPQQSYSLAT